MAKFRRRGGEVWVGSHYFPQSLQKEEQPEEKKDTQVCVVKEQEPKRTMPSMNFRAKAALEEPWKWD